MARDLDLDWMERELPAVRQSDLDFTFYGHTLRRLPEVPLHAFMTLEMDDQNRTGTVLEAIRECLAEESQATWDRVVGRRGEEAKIVEGEVVRPERPPIEGQPGVSIARVMQVWRYLVEAGSGRPTDRASDSSPGRSSNGTTSTDGSPTHAAVTLPPSPPVA